MGRRRVAGDRKRAAGQARLVRHVSAARRAARLRLFRRRVPAAVANLDRRAVLRVGLARAVPRQRHAGADRSVRAADDHRDADLCRSDEEGREEGQGAGVRGVPRLSGHAAARHDDFDHCLHLVLHAFGVQLVVGHQSAWLLAQSVPDHAVVCDPVLRRDDSDRRHPGGERPPPLR